MGPSTEILRLSAADAERYVRLRRRMLATEPWAFAASSEDDRALDVDELREMLGRDDFAIFAVEDAESGELVAAAGLIRARNLKQAHRATIWGVFVEPTFRGYGLGRAVMNATLEFACTWDGVELIDIGVSESSPAARRLYESLGFEAWGRQPEATAVQGRRYDEIYMALRVRDG